MKSAESDRTYWALWWLSSATTAIAAGMLVGHVLLLGPYLSWMLSAGKERQLAETYPVFTLSAGGPGLSLYYGVFGLQTLAGLAFLAISIARRRHVLLAAVASLAGPLWEGIHYGSRFSGLERSVLRNVSELPRDIASGFVAWNVPIHVFYAAVLLVALGVLLSVPLRVLANRPSATP